ncbi:MAG TPA: hypothetical protein VL137_06805 [Polyangiaceae bacterium]|nr:hypothetical protein [Polyangiaceae bacterium]
MAYLRPILISFAALCGALAAGACSVNADSTPTPGVCLFGPTCGMPDAGGAHGNSAQVDAATMSGGVDAALGPGADLCGSGSCMPDDPRSCVGFRPDAGAGRDASATEIAPLRQALVALADASVSDASAALDAGLIDSGPVDSGLADAGYDAETTPGEALGTYACQLTRVLGSTERQCLPAGSGREGDHCSGAADCGAGLGCVSQGTGGHCLPYCCGGTELCAVGKYCSARSLYSSNASAADRVGASPQVPVCVPAENCSLSEPFPCSGSGCVCSQGRTCSVVRDDGFTGCVVPGRGRAGETCPCAAGYFCASSTNSCLQICSTTDSTVLPCSAGRCQTTTGFPEGFGLCVGAAAQSAQAR